MPIKSLLIICMLLLALLLSTRCILSTSCHQFTQAQQFHEKLIEENIIEEGDQCYYKKIGPLTSTPPLQPNLWKVSSISIGQRKIYANNENTYTDGNISFSIHSLNGFTLDQPFSITIQKESGSRIQLPCTLYSQNKIPVIPLFRSYNDIIHAISTNNLSLMHTVTLKGILITPQQAPCMILVELENRRLEPLTLQGIEIVFNKEAKITKIFFDYKDYTNQRVNYFNPIEYNHLEITPENPVIYIKDHKWYECSGKKFYNFFDSQETRSNWHLDSSDFYNQSNQELTSLPILYSDDHQETLNQSVVWVFNDYCDTFYQLENEGILQENTDKYLYSNDGSFLSTLPYKGIFKEYLSNNTRELDYLIQVPQPQIFINKNVPIQGGHRKWTSGVYKILSINNYKVWQNINGTERDSIKFSYNKTKLDITFPDINTPYDNHQNIAWCNAAQHNLVYFPAHIHVCDQELINNLSRWNKLTKLNLSSLNLEPRVQPANFFTALGGMRQLTSLTFENNHPISNFWSVRTHKNLATRATDYYINLAACLTNLSRLKTLNIQGLWLKPYTQLGKGCCRSSWGIHYFDNPQKLYSEDDKFNVSTEVATLTGIINHNKQQGVRNIIQSICRLENLKKLSIDGIPNHGSSGYSRKTKGQTVSLGALWIASSPIHWYDGAQQNANLQNLLSSSSNQLSQRNNLTHISIYTPGGNCTDYFSHAFKSRLMQARPDITITMKNL